MTDDGKSPVQAAGRKGEDMADADAGLAETGRTGGGESGGGAYKDPGEVKGDPGASGFLGHGGQSHVDYSGPGDADDGGDNPNAPTR